MWSVNIAVPFLTIAYSFNRLKEVDKFSFNIGREENQTQCGYKHLGFWEECCFFSLIYRPWIKCSRKQQRSGKMKRHLSDWVIIMMCLLLSGDIHQCPGPVSKDFEGIILDDPDMSHRVSTVEQCRSSEVAVEWSSIVECWRDLLPCLNQEM